ncbi:MAG TPA: hypothetical protein VFE02_09815 [Candidatus Acidoferrales bacterium]|nr:hypothetical protein [Candidatus Acidoferrales bacterium]
MTRNPSLLAQNQAVSHKFIEMDQGNFSLASGKVLPSSCGIAPTAHLQLYLQLKNPSRVPTQLPVKRTLFWRTLTKETEMAAGDNAVGLAWLLQQPVVPTIVMGASSAPAANSRMVLEFLLLVPFVLFCRQFICLLLDGYALFLLFF